MRELVDLGGVKVRAHWTVLLPLVWLLAAKGAVWLGLSLLSLLIHELGHLLAARGLGFRVTGLELWPFGAALETDVAEGSRGGLLVALAGPLSGIAAGAMSLLALRLLPTAGEVLEPFFAMNLSLALINLLPAYPLDGGRVLRGLLARVMNRGRSRRVTAWTAVAAGGGLLALSAYGAMLGAGEETAFVFALFLLIAGGRTLLVSPEGELQAVLSREAAIRAGRPVEVREAACSADLAAGEALRQLRRGRYTLLRVIGKNGRLLGTIDEGTLVEGLLRRGPETTLGELVFLFDR